MSAKNSPDRCLTVLEELLGWNKGRKHGGYSNAYVPHIYSFSEQSTLCQALY